MSVRQTILNTIRKYEMVSPGGCVLVGFSGGADSVCLLDSLNSLKEELGIHVCALHVHHMLRGAKADADAVFCREFCRERGIPFTLRYADVKAQANLSGESVEEAARTLRYRLLEEEARACGADRIALAHHRNDSAETVLFHLIRGSGLRGLSGIPPVRGNIIRPLIETGRPEILRDLEARGLKHCEDESNDSDDASRNLIRHYALPALSSVRYDAAEKIAETGRYLAEADEYLTKQAEKLLAAHSANEDFAIDAALLAGEEQVMREYLVSTFLRAHGFPMKDVGRTHLAAAAALSEKSVGRRADFPGGYCAVRSYDGVCFVQKGEKDRKDPAPENDEGNAPENASEDAISGKTLVIRVFFAENPQIFPRKEYTKWFDYDKIKNQPVLRTRQPGDRISTAPGTHKKLKDWMIDEKIPQALRDSVLLVADGSDIMWAVGYRMSEEYKITGETRKVTEIRIGEEGEESDEGQDQRIDS
ncbi:MAG: tRNA lysidine(34) synthetase TilS [Lachnospiraceae bacterium]|nr:tRNA lysidine(34) synthetase TilS [Lachnospiraceae bacterium]